MITTAPEISVLMSVRNGLPYLQDAVASIIGQTLADWEFIIVDNASTDSSAAVIEEIAAREPRIRLIRNPSDLGHSGGLNRGLEMCRGRWVARMDADDIALPNRFERQLEFLRQNLDVAVTSCLAYYINGQNKTVGKTAHDLTTRGAFQRYLANNLPIGILHPGAMMSRELLVQVGGYREAFGSANDIDLWGRLVDAGAIILVQPEYLMKYRVHGGSLTAQRFQLARLKTQWARDCMRARRRGVPEPAWEEYVAQRQSAPWWLRLNRWRKATAQRLYRESGQEFISDHVFRAALHIGVAMLLQPLYTVPRLLGQRGYK